jgi:hypothetical protein
MSSATNQTPTGPMAMQNQNNSLSKASEDPSGIQNAA